ncbi:MAG TPA: amidohydrolase [Bacteroidales bacterium]|nr:amidohydrolase [Bacteroidales bacterium]HBQ84387.1 amidohydrolase [Bacteroidales bacterium]HCU21074.1 amidohydrolase [Bacteroidales bacterium]
MSSVRLLTAILCLIWFQSCDFHKQEDVTSPESILLKDFKPVSLFRIPVTNIQKARFPVIDMHTHGDYVSTPEEVDQWVKVMDETGIEKVIVLTEAHGAKFDSLADLYSAYPDRFELWCGFDYTGYNKSGYGPDAVRELVRCFGKGARGVGELGDKGRGLYYCKPEAWGMHPDDPRLDMLFDKCVELEIPLNIHFGDDIWMYENKDIYNDGLMSGWTFGIDSSMREGMGRFIVKEGMISIMENTLKRHPENIIIACHFGNLTNDLDRIAGLLDKYPNLYVDNSAKYAETATIPRFASSFYRKYQDRIVFGTDWVPTADMNRIAFRILETLDEHFYALGYFNLPLSIGYHWPMNGFGLENDILRKVYRENALKIIRQDSN